MTIVWLFINEGQPSAEKLAEAAEINEAPALVLVNNIRQVVIWWMVRCNAVLQVGGQDEDVEADEVSFRNIPVKGEDGKDKICWARFVGVVWRVALCIIGVSWRQESLTARRVGEGKLECRNGSITCYTGAPNMDMHHGLS